jgi:uncharacterized protein (DUF1810 family)
VVTDFDLNRFVQAQDIGGDFNRAVAELRRGHKSSHWMWFVFPQVAGLGRSAMSQRYAISSLREAQAYLAHPVLGARLSEVSTVILGLDGHSATAIFGSVDAQKLRSSMTLFERADVEGQTGTGPSVFRRVLDKYFDGKADPATLALLNASTSMLDQAPS